MPADDELDAGAELRRDLLARVREACELVRVELDREPPPPPQVIAFGLDVVEIMVGHLITIAPREPARAVRL